jgi:uncharacterized membrane protein YfcA
MELALTSYLLLFFGAMLSGLVDSIAGGGGMISIPLLLSVGVPPHAAIATNKLQASFGTGTAMLKYRHSRLFNFTELLPGILFTAVGASTGAILIQLINADSLSEIIPFILLALLIYTAASPQLGLTDTQERISRIPLFLMLGFFIGFYDGFFGPGTGSFWTIGLVALAGYNLKRATAVTKVMNFTSNVISLFVFILSGKVIFLIGLVMGAGQLFGAWLGAHLVITRGTKFVKVFFLSVVSITIIDLFIKQYG